MQTFINLIRPRVWSTSEAGLECTEQAADHILVALTHASQDPASHSALFCRVKHTYSIFWPRNCQLHSLPCTPASFTVQLHLYYCIRWELPSAVRASCHFCSSAPTLSNTPWSSLKSSVSSYCSAAYATQSSVMQQHMHHPFMCLPSVLESAQSPLSALLCGIVAQCACSVKRMQHTASAGHATLQHPTHIHNRGSRLAPPQAERHIPASCCQRCRVNKKTDAQQSAHLLQETSEQHPDRRQVPRRHLFPLYAPHLRLCILLDCFTICLVLLLILLPSAALQASHLQILKT